MLIAAYTEGGYLYTLQTDERLRLATESEITDSDKAEAHTPRMHISALGPSRTGAIEVEIDLDLLRQHAPELCRRRGL